VWVKWLFLFLGGRSLINKIVRKKQQEVAAAKQLVPLSTLQAKLVSGNFAFSRALRAVPWGLIAECKLASPVKGTLSCRGVQDLAALYEANGAAALSILTDSHFSGSLDHIAMARKVSNLPILRKDFIIDEYQIYEARANGASAILLIAAILTETQLHVYLGIAAELGLDCLVEVHTLAELQRVLQTPAPIIGINNRNLRDFTTDVNQTFNLLPYCDDHRLIISESGISSLATALRLQRAGVNGILVGEGLVTAANIAQKTSELSLRISSAVNMDGQCGLGE
jgi:indole-3-glycerol phosphate synthase